MAKFVWKDSTLAKVDVLANLVPKDHWLSLGGKTVQKIVKYLAQGQGAGAPSVAVVTNKLIEIGQVKGWDIPAMSSAQEKAFLVWLVSATMEPSTTTGAKAP